uniref:Uncharacterized protein n=1 Tax=Globodera rostochiensis TaxID=31243 RepID=A0A914HUL5_GLORO
MEDDDSDIEILPPRGSPGHTPGPMNIGVYPGGLAPVGPGSPVYRPGQLDYPGLSSPPGPVPVDDVERPLPIRQFAQIKALQLKTTSCAKKCRSCDKSSWRWQKNGPGGFYGHDCANVRHLPSHLCYEAVRPYILRALCRVVHEAKAGPLPVLPSELAQTELAPRRSWLSGVGPDGVGPKTELAQTELARRSWPQDGVGSTELARRSWPQDGVGSYRVSQTELAPRRSWRDGVGPDGVGPKTELH